MTARSRLISRAAASLALAALLCSTGCVGYSNYPAMQGAGGGTNTNIPDMYENAAFALKWAIQHYPPGQAVAPMTQTYHPWSKATRYQVGDPVAISFMPGMRRDSCLRMVELIGDPARPLAADTADLPTYHVSTVDVNGDAARVTVHRPIGTLDSGEPLFQAITIKLRGGLRRWTVVSHRVWDIATVNPPEANFLPDPGQTTGGSLLEVPVEPDAEPAAEIPHATPEANSEATIISE